MWINTEYNADFPTPHFAPVGIVYHRDYHLSTQGVITIDIPAESVDHRVGHTPSKQILRRLAHKLRAKTDQ